jgi:hypothetical protein
MYIHSLNTFIIYNQTHFGLQQDNKRNIKNTHTLLHCWKYGKNEY